MLPAQLDSINEGHLNDLVAGGVQESRSIEFKAELVWGTDSDKKEFLADVSALANGGGGDLIFGIEEDQGAASAVVGLDSFDPDTDRLRIENILRDGIAPRIVGVRVQPVVLNNGRMAIIVRVPKQPEPTPHGRLQAMVTILLPQLSRKVPTGRSRIEVGVHRVRERCGPDSSVPNRED